MGLADGPTEVHKVTVARQVLRDYSASDDLWPTQHLPKRTGGGRRPSSPPSSSTKWGTSDDRHRTTGDVDGRAWTSGVGEPIEQRFVSGGTQNEIYEIRRGELHGALRIPPPSAPETRDAGILREWRIIEALDGTDVPHTAAIAVCEDQSVLGRTFYLMGYVDGWSPMNTDGWPAPFDTDLDGPAGPRLRAGRRHRPAVQGRLAGQGPPGPRPPRRLPRPPGRSVDGVPRADQGPRAARLRRGRGVAARSTGRSTSSPGSCTATTSSPT